MRVQITPREHIIVSPTEIDIQDTVIFTRVIKGKIMSIERPGTINIQQFNAVVHLEDSLFEDFATIGD